MIREKIKRKEVILGTWCEIPTPYSVNIMASAGMDFVILDMEHGVFNFELIQNIIFGAHCEGCGVIIRVPEISEQYILRALDTGADGIIVPQVECKNDVKRIVEYSKYPPKGKRGFNPYIKAGGYSSVQKSYFEEQNNKVIIGIILEGKQAFEDIEEIISEEGIDVIYIGQYDLSVALGVPGDVNNKLVTDLLLKSTAIIQKNNKYAGCMVHNIDETRLAIKQGINFVVYKVDSGILFDAYHDFRKEVK